MYRYIALFLLILGLSFCTGRKRPKGIIVTNKYKSPDTIAISSPFVIYLDTCPKPYVMQIPEKGEKEYTITVRKHTEIIKIKPPKVNRLSGWDAGEYTFGADYNGDQ